MEPAVFRGVLDRIQNIGDFDWAPVTPGGHGHTAGGPLSLRTGIPYNVVRKRRYGLPGEVAVRRSLGTRRS